MESKVDISIEYSHIYTSQSFGSEQYSSTLVLKQKEKEFNKKATISKVILIDNCSTPFSIERFDLDALRKSLHQCDAEPDYYILESSLDSSCEYLADQISQKTLRKSIKNYYRTRKRWPCSMYIATWYLLRLGLLQGELLSPTGEKIVLPKAKQLITLLPDRFITPEEEAKQIINNTPFKDAIRSINVEYYSSAYEKYSDWNEFDPREYVQRNYLNQILPEDEAIVYFMSDYLQLHSSRLHPIDCFADVGCGPNLYPLMVVSPFLSKKAEVQLIDYSHNNLAYLEEELQKPAAWKHFQKVLRNHETHLYKQQTINNVFKIAKPVYGDIYKLPSRKFDLITSFFVAESITNKEENFDKAVKSLLGSVKPDGLVITAHMLGSNGYFAGWQTSFPAYNLKINKIEETYGQLENLEIFTVHHTANHASRKGYTGMVVVAGFKKS